MYLGNACQADPYQIVDTASQQGYRVLLDYTLFNASVTNMDSMAGVFLSDEDDDHPADTLKLWQRHLEQRQRNTQIPTYNGGHSNHLSGMFSGLADIQGFDFYGAGCAPHITGFLTPLPFRAPFDFLHNARNNNMPLPTWLYSQALNPGNYWTNGNEIAAEIAMTVLAGSHAMMLFGPWPHPPKGKDGLLLITPLMASLSRLNETLRTGDINGAIVTRDDDADDSMVDAIVGPQGTVLIAINMKADTYNDVLCNVLVEKHWVFHEHRVDTITMQLAQPATRVQEVVAGAFVPLRNSTTSVFNSTHMTLSNVNLGVDATVVRLFFID